jgi:hypothetical protein
MNFVGIVMELAEGAHWLILSKSVLLRGALIQDRSW